MRTWMPERVTGGGGIRTPVVVLGHGGGRSKDATEIDAVAAAFLRRGCAVLAGDWPGHGDNAEEPDASPDDILRTAAELICDPAVWAVSAKEWQVTVDTFAEAHDLGPVGYWGLSLGTVMGVGVASRVCADAAVFGLAGLVPSLCDGMQARVTSPVPCASCIRPMISSSLPNR